MGTFIQDGATELPGAKADLRPAAVPPNADEWAAADANQVREALLDLRSELLSLGTHVIHGWEVDDETARLALVPTESDVGRVARQIDNGSMWVCVGHAPAVWRPLLGVTGDALIREPVTINGELDINGTPQHVLVSFPAFDNQGDIVSGLNIRQITGDAKVHLHVVSSVGAEAHVDANGTSAEVEVYGGDLLGGHAGLHAQGAKAFTEVMNGANGLARLEAVDGEVQSRLVLTSPDGTRYQLTIPDGGGSVVIAPWFDV
jgi:hypothetical protein